MHNFNTVSVIGLGYIGLPTASLLAVKGFKVQGCDVNPQVVETINRGDIHKLSRKKQKKELLYRTYKHN